MKKIYLSALAASFIFSGALGAIAGHHGDKKMHKHAGKMFDKIDTDKDGMISMEEHNAHAEARFKAIDANADGQISKEEQKVHRIKMKEKRRQKYKEKKMEKSQ